MASEEKEGAWVKILVALIAGGATVLAATLPLYFTSQRELKKRTETADSESSTLRKQIDTLLSQLRARDAEIAALKGQRRSSILGGGVHGDTPTEPSAHAGPAHQAIAQDLKFELQGCTTSGSTVTCALLVTNLAGDRVFQIDSGRLIDAEGNEYSARRFSLGAKRGAFFINSNLLSGVPVKSALEFEAVRPSTRLIKALELVGSTLDAAHNQVSVHLTEITL